MTRGILTVAALCMCLCGGTRVFKLHEVGLMPWNVAEHCIQRRSMNPSFCCQDRHCPSRSCCKLYFVMGGYTYGSYGQCVPRNPKTNMCPRPRNCAVNADCGEGECCRLAARFDNVGVCDRLGQQGDVCTTEPVYMEAYLKHLPLTCPCSVGNNCSRYSIYKFRGTCQPTSPESVQDVDSRSASEVLTPTTTSASDRN